MRASEHYSSFSNFAVDNSGLGEAGGNFKVFGILCQYLYATVPEQLGINKDAAAIVIGPENFWYGAPGRDQGLLVDPDLGGSGAELTVIDEAGKSKTSADAWIEAKLSIANHFHGLVSLFKLAAFAGVVAASTQSEICAAFIDVLRDASIALAIQRPAVA